MITKQMYDVASELFADFTNMTMEEVEEAYKHLSRTKRRRLLAIHKKVTKEKRNGNKV